MESPGAERTIIALRFGGSMTLADIGDALGISRERVRQLEGEAIEDIAECVPADEGDVPSEGGGQSAT
jgi:DNA-directed RNA polymerase sigma subunit (sigma70/sigma32)